MFRGLSGVIMAIVGFMTQSGVSMTQSGVSMTQSGVSTSPRTGTTRAGRTLAIALAGPGAGALATATLVRIALDSIKLASQPAVRAEDVLLALIAILGALITTWFGVATLVTALAEVPGAMGSVCAKVSRRIAPAVLRRMVAFAVGTALAAAVSPVSAAYAASSAAPSSRPPTAAAVVDPPDPTLRPRGTLPVPSPVPRATPSPLPSPVPTTATSPNGAGPTSATAPDPGFVPLAPTPAPMVSAGIEALERSPRQLPTGTEGYVVRRGDTLWDIAAAHLGPAATPAQIAAEWPRWYAANRHLIGPDPGHIVPGQSLIAPPEASNAAAQPSLSAGGAGR